MREFRKGKSELARLSFESRLLYGSFLITCLISYLVMLVMAVRRAGVMPGQIADYYRGNEQADVYAKTFGEIIETTHFHFFSITIFFLVITHLFLLSSVGRRLARTVAGLTYLGVALYLAGPWMVAYTDSMVAPTALTVGRLLMVGGFLIMTALPLKEICWRTAPSGK